MFIEKIEITDFLSIRGTVRMDDSTEDLCLSDETFLKAVVRSINDAAEAIGKDKLDVDSPVRKSWETFRQEKSGDEKKTAGKWFKEISIELLSEEVSKVGLARNYAIMCRDIPDSQLKGRVVDARKVCQKIIDSLEVPRLRAKQSVGPAAGTGGTKPKS